jgi:hypothetical protein
MGSFSSGIGRSVLQEEGIEEGEKETGVERFVRNKMETGKCSNSLLQTGEVNSTLMRC